MPALIYASKLIDKIKMPLKDKCIRKMLLAKAKASKYATVQ